MSKVRRLTLDLTFYVDETTEGPNEIKQGQIEIVTGMGGKDWEHRYTFDDSKSDSWNNPAVRKAVEELTDAVRQQADNETMATANAVQEEYLKTAGGTH